MLQKGDPQRILDSGATKERKIILLWMITRLEYRTPIGEEALEALAEIVPDEGIRSAFFHIVSFASANPKLPVIIQEFAELALGVLH